MELPANASDILAAAEQEAGQLVQEAGATGAVQCVFIEDKVGYGCNPPDLPPRIDLAGQSIREPF